MCALFAATHPGAPGRSCSTERPRFTRAPGYPWAPRCRDERGRSRERRRHGRGAWTGSLRPRPERRRRRANRALVRAARTARAPRRGDRALADECQIDVRNILPSIRVPTLPASARRPTSGRAGGACASSPSDPRARFVELEGRDPSLGGGRGAVRERDRGVSDGNARGLRESTGCSRRCCSPTSSARPRGRASSATRLARISRAASRARSERDRPLPRARDRHGGGRLLRDFDGPARAVRCAQAIAMRSAVSGSRSAPGCTRARSSSSERSAAASPCTSARESPRSAGPPRSSSRDRQGSRRRLRSHASRTPASTS